MLQVQGQSLLEVFNLGFYFQAPHLEIIVAFGLS
jgi:hypothetical protein